MRHNAGTTYQPASSMKMYLVGGAVRDEMLHRPVVERDWVVTGASPQILLSKGFTQVGKDFPVFLHPTTKEEYALARVERKSGQGYTGFTCEAGPSVTLEEDLQRRDLTINAMAQDADGSIIDPFDGRSDLEQRLLKHVSDAFCEDPLRVLRVARFAARYHYLGFRIADETMALMRTMASEGMLGELTAERVWQETRRALMEFSPAVFFTTLDEAEAMNDWFTPLQPFNDDYQQILASAAQQKMPLQVRIGVLASYLPLEQAQTLCQKLKCPNDIVAICQLAAEFAQTLLSITQSAQLLEVFNSCDAWRKPERFATLLTICQLRADADGLDWSQHDVAEALKAAQHVDVQKIIALGYKGPAIRSALNDARLEVIQEKRIF